MFHSAYIYSSEFEGKKQRSKEEADAALERVPEIENQIQEAESKTRDAQANLAGAESDATMARDIAQDAQAIAEMASEVQWGGILWGTLLALCAGNPPFRWIPCTKGQ